MPEESVYTNEQRSAREKFIAQTRGYVVGTDAEGWPMIPGKYGRIEWYCDGKDCHSCPLPGQFALAVYTDRRLIRGRLLGIPGLKAHQTGDTDLRAVFLPGALQAVAKVIRARRKRRASVAQLENLGRFAFRPALEASPTPQAPREQRKRAIVRKPAEVAS